MLLIVLPLAIGCQVSKPQTSATPTPSTTLQPAPSDTALERRVLYYPNTTVYGPVPTGIEVVNINTKDGMTLEAWYAPPPESHPFILYFHGNGGNITSLGEQMKLFIELGVGALAIDYRGFGNSTGDPSEEGLYLDGLAAYDFARSRVSPDRIVIYGRSLGGGVATYVAQHRPCSHLVLESTFTSAKEVARFSHGEKGAALVDAFPNQARVDTIGIPVLLVHGMDDKTIPSRMAEELHAGFTNSELWLVKGATHNNLRKVAGTEIIIERLRQFLELQDPQELD
jgi:uncharacterized protein